MVQLYQKTITDFKTWYKENKHKMTEPQIRQFEVMMK